LFYPIKIFIRKKENENKILGYKKEFNLHPKLMFFVSFFQLQEKAHYLILADIQVNLGVKQAQ
jgi:hypothetical protein